MENMNYHHTFAILGVQGNRLFNRILQDVPPSDFTYEKRDQILHKGTLTCINAMASPQRCSKGSFRIHNADKTTWCISFLDVSRGDSLNYAFTNSYNGTVIMTVNRAHYRTSLHEIRNMLQTIANLRANINVVFAIEPLSDSSSNQHYIDWITEFVLNMNAMFNSYRMNDSLAGVIPINVSEDIAKQSSLKANMYIKNKIVTVDSLITCLDGCIGEPLLIERYNFCKKLKPNLMENKLTPSAEADHNARYRLAQALCTKEEDNIKLLSKSRENVELNVSKEVLLRINVDAMGGLDGHQHQSWISRAQKELLVFLTEKGNITDCNICHQMFKKVGVYRDNAPHAMNQLGKILPESCPWLRKISMRNRSELLVKNEICRSCFTFLSNCHNEQNCKIKIQACKVTNCNLGFMVCERHKSLNQEKLCTRVFLYGMLQFPVEFI